MAPKKDSFGTYKRKERKGKEKKELFLLLQVFCYNYFVKALIMEHGFDFLFVQSSASMVNINMRKLNV